MGALDRELRRQLDWLMTFRVVIITTLMVSTFVIELMYRPLLTLKPFYVLAVVTYAMTIAYAVLSRALAAVRPQIYAQLLGDLLVVTGFVYLTGGAASPFSFLYLLTIIIGSILLVRRGGFLVAACSWLMYASMVLLIERGLLRPYPQGSEEGEAATVRILYSLVAHLVSFFAVAYLASYLSENLRRTGKELELRRDDLAKLRDYNDNIIESMNSGLLTTDREGIVTFANRGAMEITGGSNDSLIGRGIVQVLGQGPDFLRRVQEALESKKRFRTELDYEDGRGRRIFLGFTVSVLRERAGSPIGMIFIFQDLTEIRALEEEVALKKRMAALGEMAAGVAHELRNPLASISGSVQVLKRDLRPQADAAELMDIVIKESKRLDQIVRDFLMFAKPGRFHPETADLAAVLGEALSLLENSDERRPHHQVRTRFHPEVIRFDFDVNRMKQLFWNLAKNALRAMPEGGMLTVSADDRGDGQVMVTFSDTGIGMSEEDIATNFQPFHGSFPSGTGLGLAIVYRIVEEHGGRIRVKSGKARGTEIAVYLPRRTSVMPAREERRWTAS
jgi:two-component system, NtrC family, sensor histidine kinase PilS